MKLLTVWLTILLTLLIMPYASADRISAAETDSFTVLNRGVKEIVIDANLGDWETGNVLVMGEDTWEAFQGGTWDNEDDLTGELQVLYDEDNLYFALLVKDDEYVAEGGGPWENDGVQIAIDTSGGQIPPGWPNDTTHLYNFSIKNGWQKEAGPFLGDAEIEMKRDDSAKQNIFEWRMPAEIVAAPGTKFEPGMEIAFAIIINDSDENAKGQKGWIGWGNHTIVFGKNPEEMKTLILAEDVVTAVSAEDKLLTTWGKLKH